MFAPETQHARALLTHWEVSPSAANLVEAGSLGGLGGSEFWKIQLRDQSLLLRCWPPHGNAEHVSRTHLLLHWAERHGVSFLPTPRATADGCTYLQRHGRLWELTTWLPGDAVSDRVPSTEQVVQACQGLANFHNAVARCPGHVPSFAAPKSVVKRIRRLHDAFGSSWLFRPIESYDSHVISPTQAERLRTQLVANLPAVRRLIETVADKRYPVQTIHGDARREHFLFSHNQLTGLVDFGAVTYDTPMVDLARLLGEFSVDAPHVWREGVQAYGCVRSISDSERALLPVLDRSGVVLAIFQWLAWIGQENRIFPDESAVQERLTWLERRLTQFA